MRLLAVGVYVCPGFAQTSSELLKLLHKLDMMVHHHECHAKN